MEIKIKLLADNRQAQLICNDIAIVADLAKLMAVRHEGARFTPAYKVGAWDGYIKLMNADRTFPVGLVPMAIDYCKKQYSTSPIIEDARNCEVPKVQVYDTIGDKKLRDYQVDMVRSALTNNVEGVPFIRGIIAAATNAGKSLIAASIIKGLSDGVTVLFLCPKYEILQQVHDWYSDYFPDEQIGMVHRSKFDVQRVTVGLITTLYARRHTDAVFNLLRSTDCLFIDEAQHAHSESWTKVIHLCTAYYKFALSGTALSLNKRKRTLLESIFGPVISQITNKELIALGYSAKPTVYLVQYPEKNISKYKDYKVARKHVDTIQPEIEAARIKGKVWDEVQLQKKIAKYRTGLYESVYTHGIVKNGYRNSAIVRIVRRHKGVSILVVVISPYHGRLLKKKLRKYGVRAVNIDGNTMQYKREAVRKKFISGKIKVVIASLIWKIGVDVPAIDVLVYAGGEKSVDTVLQTCGRALRKSEDSDEVRIYDFDDRCNDYLESHTELRKLYYRRENFKIKNILSTRVV